jgi:hypothetical protein
MVRMQPTGYQENFRYRPAFSSLSSAASLVMGDTNSPDDVKEIRKTMKEIDSFEKQKEHLKELLKGTPEERRQEYNDIYSAVSEVEVYNGAKIRQNAGYGIFIAGGFAVVGLTITGILAGPAVGMSILGVVASTAIIPHLFTRHLLVTRPGKKADTAVKKEIMKELPGIEKKQEEARSKIQEVQRRRELKLHQEALAEMEKAAMTPSEVSIDEDCVEIEGVRLQKNKKSCFHDTRWV